MSDITVQAPTAFAARRLSASLPISARSARVDISPRAARDAVGLDSGLERIGLRRGLRRLFRVPFRFDHR